MDPSGVCIHWATPETPSVYLNRTDVPEKCVSFGNLKIYIFVRWPCLPKLQWGIVDIICWDRAMVPTMDHENVSHRFPVTEGLILAPGPQIYACLCPEAMILSQRLRAAGSIKTAIPRSHWTSWHLTWLQDFQMVQQNLPPAAPGTAIWDGGFHPIVPSSLSNLASALHQGPGTSLNFHSSLPISPTGMVPGRIIAVNPTLASASQRICTRTYTKYQRIQPHCLYLSPGSKDSLPEWTKFHVCRYLGEAP